MTNTNSIFLQCPADFVDCRCGDRPRIRIDIEESNIAVTECGKASGTVYPSECFPRVYTAYSAALADGKPTPDTPDALLVLCREEWNKDAKVQDPAFYDLLCKDLPRWEKEGATNES